MVFSSLDRLESAKVAGMKTTDAIVHFETATKLAGGIGVTVGAISQWGDYPPDRRQLQIERLTKGKLKAEPGCKERALGLSEPAKAS